MTVSGAKRPLYCTNPIAFAAPLDEGPPLLIDQASSATAFVQLRHYAERGEPLPPGWAVDGDGEPTTDPKAALRGALLAFGGARGANIALMVEVMAAGLAGANWALDAPSFTSGDRSPGAGLLVIALTPSLLAPDFPQRLILQLDWLAKLGVHIPGRRGAATEIELPDELVAEIERAGAATHFSRAAREAERGSWSGDMAKRLSWRHLLGTLAGLPLATGLADHASAAPGRMPASALATRHGLQKRAGINSIATWRDASSRCGRPWPTV